MIPADRHPERLAARRRLPSMHGHPRARRRRTARTVIAGWLVTASLVAGCGMLASPAPTTLSLPAPTCGGAKIAIPGALPCDDLVGIALDSLRGEAPALLDRGVIAVSVEL